MGRSFRAIWNAKRAEDGYDAGSGVDAASPKARMARTMQRFVDGFEDVPVVILACLVRYRTAHVLEGASVYPACQNLLLAARALGLGGVMTTWHEPVEDELKRILDIPEGVAVMATIPLGYPEGHHGPVRRRPLRELVFEDRWGEAPGWAVDPPGTAFTQAGPPTNDS
jgi:nitroreductase